MAMHRLPGTTSCSFLKWQLPQSKRLLKLLTERCTESQPGSCWHSVGDMPSAFHSKQHLDTAPCKACAAHQCSVLRLRHGLLLLNRVAQHRLAVQSGGRRRLPLDCTVRLLLLEVRRLLQLLLLLLGEVQTVAALLQMSSLQRGGRHLRSSCWGRWCRQATAGQTVHPAASLTMLFSELPTWTACLSTVDSCCSTCGLLTSSEAMTSLMAAT